jgi:hypothetical protein
MTAAVAGWAAGAMSMAAGEYVSVSSQADSEAADLKREQRALSERPAEEKEELAHIYEERGLKPKLAKQVAGQLMAKDALDAHAPRRAWPERGRKAKPNPGRLGVGGFIFGWRRTADPCGVSRPAGRRRHSRLGRLIDLLGGARRGRRQGWRRPDRLAGAKSRLLGRARHGRDGGNRRPGRQGGLTSLRRRRTQLTVSAL